MAGTTEVLDNCRVGMGQYDCTLPRFDAAAWLGVEHRFWALGCLAAVFSIEWIDRSLLVIALEPIKVDLGLVDQQVGIVAAMSHWTAALVVLPVARLADSFSRRDIIACSILIWALGTATSGCVGSYLGLLLTRSIVGVGIAGFMPVSTALLTDFFPPAERGRAFGVFSLGWQSGNLFGYILGGWLIRRFTWHRAFVYIGLPQIVMAAVLHWSVASPRTQPNTRSCTSDVCTLASLRTMRYTWAASLMSTIGTAMFKFLPSFYIRVHGLTVDQVGVGLGLTTGIISGMGEVRAA
eukprot:SAG31_NODE_1429_length_8390_cov_2.259076_1_plen_294_part_00